MKHFLIFFILLAQASYASTELNLTDEQSESTEVIEIGNDETPKISINEIKQFLSTTEQNSTCLDEYLHRRRQLFTKLAFTPLLATVETLGAAYIGGTTGVLIAQARSGSTEAGWDALGYAIGGAMIGGAVSIVATAVNTTQTGLEIYDNDLLIKSLGELYLNKEKHKVIKLYQTYSKAADKPMSEEEFFKELLDSDKAGSLCDGSMVKQPRFHFFSSKLKYKVARPKDINRALINQ